jgi:hypothetical protein
MLSKYLSGAGLALAAGLLCAPASAAPVGNVAGVHTPNTSNVEQAAYRRCWWHNGHRHCRLYRTYGYGYGPTFGFSFGGGRHFHGGGHHGGGHHR